MRQEISAGGVVIFGNAILLLKKYNGDWVLPKGKVENHETLEQTAVREVFEEASVKVAIVKYLGEIKYTYKNCWDDNSVVNKTVYWFLMQSKSIDCIPLKEEGFIEAKFIHIDRAVDLAKYEDEKEIIVKAIDEFKRDPI
ncbi:NUDIX hydrolase [Serpentinicella alkaliphila]|uniref:NUDIX domain-containing protein n=1 Tax=Serpentinicella alkaliphila TaxID=1734049 RepID=A0A4R2U8K1_9FIRM|nr:NUDIX hydrolase [Serpentinicella alkaliphila]QUH25696.1 NUDIX hydrolase [Serpentinicella alkaliphila]TCQ06589.1 NUDIX domain-containing protein [Serpentinicella alkaliphila]